MLGITLLQEIWREVINSYVALSTFLGLAHMRLGKMLMGDAQTEPRVVFRPSWVTPKLVILDLDKTIIREPFEDTVESIVPRLDTLFYDVDFFRYFVRCCTEFGHVVRIATFASVDVPLSHSTSAATETSQRIAAMMQHVLGDGDLCVAWHIKSGRATSKADHYRRLIDEASQLLGMKLSGSDVLVIDDSQQSMEDASQMQLRGFLCCGFTREWFASQRQLWIDLGFRDAAGSIPSFPP